MAEKIVEHIYKLKGGNQEAVERENVMLERREPLVVFCEDGKTRLKVGDGKHTSNELDYIGEQDLSGYATKESLVGEKTSQGGEVFNDYENNKANAEYNHAEGLMAVAGATGFEIDEVRTEQVAEEYILVNKDGGYYQEAYTRHILTVLNEDISQYYQLDDVVQFLFSSAKYSNDVKICNIEVIDGNSYITVCKIEPRTFPLYDNQGGTYHIIVDYCSDLSIPALASSDNWIYAFYLDKSKTPKEQLRNTPYPIPDHWASHVEGRLNQGYGQGVHVEGGRNLIQGDYSHGEGCLNKVSAENAHVEGTRNIVKGIDAHGEGWTTESNGWGSHSEGVGTKALKDGSHAEGSGTTAQEPYTHAEGKNTKALGTAAHSEGTSTEASGNNSHAEGNSTKAMGIDAHAEGKGTKATGTAAHSQNLDTTASGANSNAQGRGATASGENSDAGGLNTEANGNPVSVYYELNAPIEESITLPTLPTFKGTTIIEIDTEIPLSNIEIEYKGK